MRESFELEEKTPIVYGEPHLFNIEIIKIMDALAHEDALKIFIYTREGITNSTVARKKLGLTQKRYYTRLKQLLNAGLLERREDGYRYTALGNIVYQMGRRFKNLIGYRDRLELADKLGKTETLSLEEKKRLMGLITPTEAGEVSSLADLINPVRMVEDYEDLVKNLVEAIDRAEESVYLVSKYNDVRVIEAIIRALDRGVKMRALARKSGITDRINMLRALLSPSMFGVILKASKELSAMIRKTEISYSFVVLDEKVAGIEVPHPTRDTFYLGFIFENVDVCKRLSKTFNEMWEKAGEVPLL